LPKWKDGSSVLICEGEKDADATAELGLPSTTGPFGATSWPVELTHWFKDKQVFICFDIGEERAAENVAASLYGTAREIRICRLPLTEHEADVTDYINQVPPSDLQRAQQIKLVQDLLKNAELYQPPGRVTDNPTVLSEAEREALSKVESAWKHLTEKNPKEVTFDSSEFTDIQMRPIKWLWYPIAPVGMVGTVLGEPGIGKTFLLADLAARVSSGRPLPIYRKPTDQVAHGWVIYITSEGVADQILKPRLYAAGADMANITLIKGIMTREGDYDLLDIRRHLVPLVARIKQDNRKCVLVIIDPMASFVNGKTNLNDSVQTRHALDAVARFAENADIAVLVAIHPNKDETLKIMSRASGSIQMSAAVKSAWVVADPEEGDPQNMRYFSPYKITTVPFNKKETLPFFLESADFEQDGKNIEMANLRWSTKIVKCDVEKIISPRASEAGVNQTAKACAMLKDTLKNGPRFSDELFALAESLGIGHRPLYAAKARLAIKASPEHFSGKWKWISPDTWPEKEGNIRE